MLGFQKLNVRLNNDSPNGRILYETPEGERVEVTQVTKKKEHNCSGKVAEDISYLGLVKDSCIEGLKEKFSESS